MISFVFLAVDAEDSKTSDCRGLVLFKAQVAVAEKSPAPLMQDKILGYPKIKVGGQPQAAIAVDR